MLIDTALYFSSFPSKISSHSEAFSRVTLVAVNEQSSREQRHSSFSFFLGGNICLQQEVQLNTKIKDISYKFYFKKEKVFTIAL